MPSFDSGLLERDERIKELEDHLSDLQEST